MLKALALVPLLSTFVYAATFTVGVGKDETTGKKGKGFDPSEIYPAAGDTIVFEFRSGAHSVVESTFDKPCAPKEGGYDSTVFTVDDNVEVDASGLPTVELTVTGKDPVWFFDQAGGLCSQGAVLAINAQIGGTQSAAAFKANASGAPGEDAGSSTGAPPASSNSASQSNTSSPSPSPSPSGGSGSGSQDDTDGATQLVTGLSVVVAGLLSGFMLV